MTKQFIIIILILCCSYELFAQTHPTTIRTARPGETVEPFVVGKNILQLQTGFSYRLEEYELFERSTAQLNQEFRLGLSEFFEVQFSTGFVNINNIYVVGIPEDPRGISNTQFGFKINISDGSKVPAMGIQYRFITRLVDSEFRPQTVGSRLFFSIGQQVHKDLALYANLGIERDGNELAPKGMYAIKVKVISVPRAEFMMEYFGKVPLSENLFDQKWTSNINFGVGFWILPNFKVDATAGGNVEQEEDQVVWEVGLSWRGFLSKKEINVSE